MWDQSVTSFSWSVKQDFSTGFTMIDVLITWLSVTNQVVWSCTNQTAAGYHQDCYYSSYKLKKNYDSSKSSNSIDNKTKKSKAAGDLLEELLLPSGSQIAEQALQLLLQSANRVTENWVYNDLKLIAIIINIGF